LYRRDINRGRGYLKEVETKQLGMMLSTSGEDTKGLPIHQSTWHSDVLSQQPNYATQTVQDLIDNDAVYVSGPSGMTTLFLGLMETVANLENIQLKQYYLAAIVAYIAGGGFHSMHEIIGPSEHCLYLVPGYNVSVPDTIMRIKAAPPNYNHFFELLASIDPEIMNRREVAWDRFIDYFKTNYAPRNLASLVQRSRLMIDALSSSSPGLNTHVSPSIEAEQKQNYSEYNSAFRWIIKYWARNKTHHEMLCDELYLDRFYENKF
jgi:hypothetical protein